MMQLLLVLPLFGGPGLMLGLDHGMATRRVVYGVRYEEH